jgi:hypothetical protein
MQLDKDCYDIIDNNINMAVPWYIMAAYSYYVDDEPILSDSAFDRLAKKILSNWEEIDHYHKEYLNKDMLKAGTYLGNYPSRVKDAVEQVKEIYRATKSK